MAVLVGQAAADWAGEQAELAAATEEGTPIIALTNGGAIRASFEPGDITAQMVESLWPWDDT